MSQGFIDVHHHFFPSTLNKEGINEHVGWRTPIGHLPWTPELSLKFMNQAGIETAILSFPALSAGSVSEENRVLARERNVHMAEICEQHAGRFGFFATLPFLHDVQGVLAEIAFALDVLKSDGISISSSYGDGSAAKYVGDQLYEPIWAELNLRQATVFLHGVQTPSSTPHPDETLGLPVVEVPNETFKAAAHLVVTSTKRKYPDVKIILSHLGGSTPFLSSRVGVLSNYMGCPLTPEEIISDFKTFYFDTALSAHETTLTAMQTFVTPDRLLFGSDFPAVSTDMVNWYTKNLEDFYSQKRDVLEDITSQNALILFPRLQNRTCLIGPSTSGESKI